MVKAEKTDLEYLDHLLTTLKRHGATHFDDGSFRIDLHPQISLGPVDGFKRPTADEIAEEDEEERQYRADLKAAAARRGHDPDDEAVDDGPAQ